MFFGPIGNTRWLLWPLFAEKFSTSLKFKETWQEARSQRPLSSLCFSGRLEKQDGRLASDCLRHFWHLFRNCWTEFNETWQEARPQRPHSSFCFLGRIRKKRWLTWPLIGWDIFYFSSETAKLNSTELDRKQDLNVLYQVCVFRADRKNKMAGPSFWLAETFSTSYLKTLNRIQGNLTGNKISTSSTKFVFFKPIKKQDGRLASYWLRQFPLLWNLWMEFNETWQEARSQHHLPSFCVACEA